MRPPWEGPSDREGAEEIVIDPGQAFGTGAHATTRLCLELLLELASSDPDCGAVLDIGTGSGVLAIAAARLGFAPVLGLDHERESVAAAEENARVNEVTIEVRHFDLRAHALPWLDGARRTDRRDRLWWWRTCCVLCCSIWRAGCPAPRHICWPGDC